MRTDTKVTPRILDTPATFTIEWEDSLQKPGLILTGKLKEIIAEIDQGD